MDAGDAVHYVVAHLYQRSGRRALSENELVNAMSLDLKWYPPKDARNLVAAMAREGHLRRTDDGELEPTIDVREVKVPLAFRPPQGLARGGVPEAGNSPPAPPAAPPAAPAPQPSQQSSEQPSDNEVSARPASDQAAQDVAAGTDDAGDDAPDTTLGTLLDALAERTGDGAGDWVQRMDAVIQASADTLTPEAALLLAAAERGVDVRPWLQAARAAL